MQTETLSLSRQNVEALAQALAVIEQQYPDHVIQLVPKNSGKTATNGSAVKTSVKKRVDASCRELVEDASRRKPISLADLADATGLTKSQIRGVLNAPSQKEYYTRTDEQADGSKLYQYIGPERE